MIFPRKRTVMELDDSEGKNHRKPKIAGEEMDENARPGTANAACKYLSGLILR